MDKEVFDLIEKESKRQEETVDLIASENYASKAVREATGSILTNKYAEGYPSKRYYQGCKIIDEVEDLAIKRAKELFGAEHVNVQPYSGSTANMAVYFSVLKPEDTIMGMALSSGGHLTHGAPVSFSGTVFNSVSYSVDFNTGLLNYDEIEALAKDMRPKMIVAGHSAHSRIIDFERFSKIAKEVDAYLLADISHISGLIIAGLHPSPIPYADFVMSTTHKTLRGPRGAFIMCKKEYKDALDRAVFPFLQGGPFEHIIAAKAVAFKEAMSDEFKEYQERIVRNAKALCDELQKLGYDIVSGTTENHVMVVDLRKNNLTGKDLAKALEKANIVVSKSTVPNDPQSPFVTSGIRLGTPAVSTRGMGENEMVEIAHFIDEVAKSINNDETLIEISKRVKNLTSEFIIGI